MAKNTAVPDSDVVALAHSCLRARKDTCEELDEREFWDEEEAHDDALVEETHGQFLRKMQEYRRLLATEFGGPAVVGKDEHDAIPRNGILEHAIWHVKGKSLFLAVSHEDTELPCLILLGVTKNLA